MTAPHIVLVHGAWNGGWYWDETAVKLREFGHEVTIIDQLPSGTGDPGQGLAADAAHLRQAVASIGGPVALVGHSYGGMVISQLAGEPSVAAAIYLTAFLPQNGVSFVEAAGGKLARWIEVDEAAGLSRIAEAAAAKVVTPGMSDAEAAPILARLTPQSLSSFTEPSANAGWGEVPVTFIVCTEDRVIPEAVQRSMAAHEPHTQIIEIATGHFPMFTAVEESAAAIATATATEQAA